MNLNIYSNINDIPEYLRDANRVLPLSTLPENGVHLIYDENGLALAKCAQKGTVRVEFATGAAQHRRTQGGGELIAKAVNHSSKPVVWDATGGLGRDSFVLASLGLNVLIFEQNPSAFLLLLDGIERAKRLPEIATIVAKMSLHFGNFAEIAPKIAEKPDIVYLDPMYPERQKSAAIKKEMAYFHELIGLPENHADEQLFQAARQIAKKRVVVKRPRLGEFLCGAKPAYQYEGKSTRFDVYLPFQAA